MLLMKYFARCKVVKPGKVLSKIKVNESGTDPIIISRCILSFKTIITPLNIIVFKVKISAAKADWLLLEKSVYSL